MRLPAPVAPPNIIAIGMNYRAHAAETGRTPPERPLIFLKATTSVCGNGDEIRLPAPARGEVDFEAELAVVIAKTARRVPVERAREYVLGYTCGNDVSARDCQMKLDQQWARGKSFDTFCPLGPWIETELDPAALKIESRLNGEVMQSSSTADMIFGVDELISYISHQMTLLAGTVIMTGTPAGVGVARKPQRFLRPGDVIEVEIAGIGTLSNRVVEGD